MVPNHYIPNSLSSKDKKKQEKELMKSKKYYKNKKYYQRKKINSFISKVSPHITKAQKVYNIDSIKPSNLLSKKTKCKISGLKAIVKKGEGAYYSSGSRPNQTSKSWGIARLASAITGGKSSKIDYHILSKYCSKKSLALQKAIKPKIKKTIKSKIKKAEKPNNKKTEKYKRNKNGELIFTDYPEFKPNLTPKEIFEMGSFGGTYFRQIYSSVINKKLKDQHLEFKKWFTKIDIDTYVTNNTCNVSINKYKVKAGTSLDDWEKSGWITKYDPYGWFQWYCRFYMGRRCDDDKRQVGRWINYAGEKSGRWRLRLINLCKNNKLNYNNYEISPVIRQGLQHWGFILKKNHIN
tara:strand:+ start:85 stop:1134 length:1050 start_codon:yes stop_codon:yes gene_type:complete